MLIVFVQELRKQLVEPLKNIKCKLTVNSISLVLYAY